ncbi:MAG TPA: hypothetical protein VFS62_08995 [Chloroflexota bacterium]|nr:hypothetical protein [Chloroflexota bacterium]
MSSSRWMASALMLLAAVTLGGASAIHFGLVLDDRFAGAAVPEAVLGAILFAGWLALVVGGPNMRAVALGAIILALVGTIYGLSVTLGSARTGDVAYHFTLLAMLLGGAALLAIPHRAPVTSA